MGFLPSWRPWMIMIRTIVVVEAVATGVIKTAVEIGLTTRSSKLS